MDPISGDDRRQRALGGNSDSQLVNRGHMGGGDSNFLKFHTVLIGKRVFFDKGTIIL